MSARVNVPSTAVRFVHEGDGPAIDSITGQSPEAAIWPAEAFASRGVDGRHAWVVTVDAAVEGFLLARVVADECEILNLAVSRDWRRRGLGSQLLAAALEFARRSGSQRCHVEVRGSNQPAVEFYRRHGFAKSGIRRGYYREPPDHALLMVRNENVPA